MLTGTVTSRGTFLTIQISQPGQEGSETKEGVEGWVTQKHWVPDPLQSEESRQVFRNPLAPTVHSTALRLKASLFWVIRHFFLCSPFLIFSAERDSPCWLGTVSATKSHLSLGEQPCASHRCSLQSDFCLQILGPSWAVSWGAGLSFSDAGIFHSQK